MKPGRRHPATEAVHAGEPVPRICGAVSMPVFQTAMYEYGGESGYHSIPYIRLNNTPNHVAVHEKLAALCHAEAALVTASGMAAISACLLACLQAGDHLLAHDCLYGGTFTLIQRDFPGLNITSGPIDVGDPSSWERALRPHTKAVLVETMTNPLLGVGDLAAIPRFARAHGLISIIDNTFATPLNFRPLDCGYDLSVHSCTKYLNGHSDIVAGAVAGSAALVRRVTHKLNHLGGALDPHACFLLHRGLKTLALRMAAHNHNGMAVAEMLEGHPAVARVNYPGLASHPDHQRAARLLNGFSGMMSLELKGGVQAADKLMRRLQIPISAPSLGGVESLVTRPATTSHSGVDPADRQRLGVTDSLVRLSVGIESAEDLIADLEQALAD